MRSERLGGEGSTAVRIAFVVLAIAVAVLFALGVGVAARRRGESSAAQRRLVLLATTGTAAWMLVTAALAASGVLRRADAHPPPMLGIFASALVLPIAVGLSPIGARIAGGLPIAALVGVQAFRLPLEIAMHQAAREGVMPERMSFTGTNFDILTGASAIVVAALAARGRAPRALVALWNLVGAALLANVVVTAVLASPMIHAFGTDPRDVNAFVANFPFVWLPAVLVPGAVLGHVAVARALRRT